MAWTSHAQNSILLNADFYFDVCWCEFKVTIQSS